MNDKKTVRQIINEYKKRQETPAFSRIKVRDSTNNVLTYDDVTNIQNVYEDATWLEFDSTYNNTSRHIRILGGCIIQYVEPLEKVKIKETVNHCKLLIIRTPIGKREIFANIKNLVSNEQTNKVEFDIIIDTKWVHRKMNGTIEQYDQVIE